MNELIDVEWGNPDKIVIENFVETGYAVSHRYNFVKRVSNIITFK